MKWRSLEESKPGQDTRPLREQFAERRALIENLVPPELTAVHRQVVEDLKRSGIADRIPQPGAKAPAFTLPDQNGKPVSLALLKGKKVLIVNTASDCGYTDQYAELEKLYQQYKGQLEILAFPANDFKEQEKGNDAAIAEFCKKNYGVSFPLMARSTVIKSANQNPVFNWLTNPASNGWNSKLPGWNFSKYLVNDKGQLTHYFDSGVSPLSKEVINAIKEN